VGDATEEIMKAYNYILFDWDGCLAKTLDIWLDAYKEVFANYGIYPDDKVITQQVFGDWQGPAKLGIKSMDEYNRLLLTKVAQGYTTLKLYDNALEILQELKKRNKKLALITSSKRNLLMPALNRLDLSSMFDSILTAEDVTRHKPDPEVIHKTLTNLDAQKTESILIGDTKEDVRGAQNEGIDSILFYPKHNQAFYESKVILLSHPTYIIDDFRKLLDIIV
jgi:pyrophosphatase PpaX